MASAAAIAFDQSARTATDLRNFWSQDPVAAAKWLTKVADAAGMQAPGLDQVKQALALNQTDEFVANQLRSIGQQFPALFDFLPQQMGEVQNDRAATIGWVAIPQPQREPPTFSGRLQLQDGVVKLVTTRGTFDLTYAPGVNWRDEVETAFLNQVITIKGWPSADGKTLLFEQFAPGTDPNFISGRISVEGDEVYIANGYNDTRRTKITHPEFAALLKGDPSRGLVNYSPAGVILHGEVTTDPATGERVYPHNPERFYILGRIFNAEEVPIDERKKVLHGETGYFRHTPFVVPTSLNIPPNSRAGAPHPIPGDTTVGSTQPGEGHRTFFYVKILPNDAELPTLPFQAQRKLEVTWVGDASDQGRHSVTYGVQPAQDLDALANTVPAATPDTTPEEATFEPEDAASF